jgi:hypothetical protein
LEKAAEKVENLAVQIESASRADAFAETRKVFYAVCSKVGDVDEAD